MGESPNASGAGILFMGFAVAGVYVLIRSVLRAFARPMTGLEE